MAHWARRFCDYLRQRAVEFDRWNDLSVGQPARRPERRDVQYRQPDQQRHNPRPDASFLSFIAHSNIIRAEAGEGMAACDRGLLRYRPAAGTLIPAAILLHLPRPSGVQSGDGRIEKRSDEFHRTGCATRRVARCHDLVASRRPRRELRAEWNARISRSHLPDRFRDEPRRVRLAEPQMPSRLTGTYVNSAPHSEGAIHSGKGPLWPVTEDHCPVGWLQTLQRNCRLERNSEGCNVIVIPIDDRDSWREGRRRWPVRRTFRQRISCNLAMHG